MYLEGEDIKMKVCIVGGGHIGTTLACYIKHVHPNYNVSIFTQHPGSFLELVKCNDIEKGISYVEKLDTISNDPKLAVQEAKIIFVALPHFAVENAFASIAPFVDEDVFVGVLPGGGGCEFFFHKYFNTSATLFGFQRVPFTAKLVDYGKETNLKSWKPYSVVGTLYRDRIEKCCNLIEECGLKTKKASNYLEIALTPTNPILHTSRTYELFGKHDRNYVFAQREKFYMGWSDFASSILFSMDKELHNLLDAMDGIETSAIRPLSEHYESPTVQDLTRKINSIETFKSVYAPMKEVEQGYIADTSSRMFTEDFPWGLIVIRSYFDYFNISAPTMDQVLKWYSDYMGYEWFFSGKLIGKDIYKTGIIQRYDIANKEELLQYYKR